MTETEQSVTLTREEFDTLILAQKDVLKYEGKTSASINRHTTINLMMGISIVLGLVTLGVKISSFATKDALWKHRLESEIRAMGSDRFTGKMFIQVQDELETLNPTLNWLGAKDVTRIQNENPPYKAAP